MRLAVPLPSPFDVEHVVVPGGPMRDWLAAALADRLGVWCNHAVYTPSRLLERLGGPQAAVPSAWKLRDALLARLGSPGFDAPTRYLAGDATGIRSIQLATRVATLFGTYGRYRPEMVARWGTGVASAAEGWQATLWRDVQETSDQSGPAPSTPRRLTVFAVDHLAPLELALLHSLGPSCHVAVLALAGSPAAAALGDVQPAATRTASVLVHSTHGKLREVEVLRDRLLTLFATDPTLQPEDVLILAPDINDYAALLDGVFASEADISKRPGSQARIPLCFADRSPLVDAPGLAAMKALLTLPNSRRPLSVVAELFSIGPVHAQFGLSEDDAVNARTWLEAATVRWADDASLRARFDNPALPQHTWRWGLDRLLLGYAIEGDDERLFGELLPAGGLEGKNALPLGGLCAFCDTLFAQLHRLEGVYSPTEWGSVLLTAYDSLVSTRGPWAASRLTLVAALSALSGSTPVGIGAVADWLLGQLEQVERHERFFAGGVTCASLRTGRVVPMRVIAMLGLDYDRFPRDPTPLAFDLVAAQPAPGDLTARAEDRLTFQNATLAARDHLHLSYTGHGSRDNKERPPSVVVAECNATTIEHPMQGFSPAAFSDPRVPNYSLSHHRGAQALLSPRQPIPPFFPSPLPPDASATTVNLAVLLRFFLNPVAALLSRRLDLKFAEAQESAGDREPFDMSFLEQWKVGDRLVRAGVQGKELEALWPAVCASGLLPMGTPGRAYFDGLAEAAAGIVETALTCGAGDVQHNVDLDITLPNGRITGRLDGRRSAGGLYVTYSKLDAKRRLPGWLRHLAAQAAGLKPATTWLVGRGKAGSGDVVCWGEVAESERWLGQLLALSVEGMTRPLPFFPKASFGYASAYLNARSVGTSDSDARQLGSLEALKSWFGAKLPGQDPIPGEGDDPAVSRVFDRSVLWSEEFARIALRVYAPMTGVYTLPESRP